ncbi:ASCH domain-containing protein [Streptomyces sp. NRRL WC-3742]|uniref:ASCH domain-containing protein n=1 Tax=Streptomyces sp. NRRL WC-3742 TaxID=1463934 RepID=UPI00068C666D|nr:ASCH domain-containing protein [Streptomyces sp. NRRL WC-3742]
MTVIALNPDSPASHAVGVDYDQTLADHPEWRGGQVYGQPLPGAIAALRTLLDKRAVFVFTARHPRTHHDVARWLEHHVGCRTSVDTDPDRAYWLERHHLLVTNKKLGAALYVDDRSLTFTGDWDTALAEALRRIGEPPDPSALGTAAPALTIRQPWLAAILAGDKRVENRSWPTKHRGLVVLHAARALARDGQADPLVRAALARPGAPALTTGAIVATASITDCHRDTGCCRPWGLPGLWHWTIEEVHALADPIPAAGRLGLWRLDPGQHALLHRHRATARTALADL